MRFTSKGIDGISCPCISAMTFLLTAFRCALFLKIMKEKNAVSDGFRAASFLKLPHWGIPARSSPTHSKYCSAPCFIHIFLPHAAIFLYSATFPLGTGITKPSTYVMSCLLRFDPVTHKSNEELRNRQLLAISAAIDT